MRIYWKRLIGDTTVLGVTILLFLTYLAMSIGAIFNNGNYSFLIKTNEFYEHYPELVLFAIGIFFFISNIKLKNYIEPQLEINNNVEVDVWDLIYNVFEED
jgi:hypothetical protein